jgi:hypothetical protein
MYVIYKLLDQVPLFNYQKAYYPEQYVWHSHNVEDALVDSSSNRSGRGTVFRHGFAHYALCGDIQEQKADEHCESHLGDVLGGWLHP